jgi:hypothetical protein
MAPGIPAAEPRRWLLCEATAGALLVLFAAVVMWRVELQLATDDGIFLHALEGRSVGEFLVARYRDWSGRTLLEGLLVSTIGLPAAWKLGIPLALVGTAACIWRLTLSARLPPLSGTAVALLLLMSIHAMVLAEAVFWVSGFYNYLLPAFLGLLAFTALHARGTGDAVALALAAPALAVACQSEQVGAMAIIVLMVRIALRRRERLGVRIEVVLLGVATASALGSWMAPGNAARMEAELRWFPEYVQAGWLEKLGMGLDRLSVHARSPRNLLLVAVAALSAATVLRASRSPAARIAAAILLIHILGAIASLLARIAGGGPAWLAGPGAHLTPPEWIHAAAFLSMGFTICVYGALATAAACRARTVEGLVVGAGLPLLAAASTVMVALSPTIYASGFRILFVGDLLLAIHGAMLVATLPGLRTWSRVTAPRLSAPV